MNMEEFSNYELNQYEMQVLLGGENGADKLVLADMNEEAANLLRPVDNYS